MEEKKDVNTSDGAFSLSPVQADTNKFAVTNDDDNRNEEIEQFSFDKLKPKVKPVWKAVFLIVLIACIGASLYFSFNALSLDTYEFSETEDGWQLTGFHNDGTTKEIVVDYVLVKNGIHWEKDETRPIVSIKKFALCCDNTIEKITIGKSVSVIEDQAFYSCQKLQAIFVHEDNLNYLSDNGILFTKDRTEIVQFPISYVAYESNTIKEGSGENATMRYKVPDSVVVVRPLCFAYAENLVEVTLSDNVKELGTLAFFKCSSLASLELPDGLETIGSDAFSYCKKLTYMFIPSTVTSIGHHAFYECAGLSELNVEKEESDFKKIDLGDYWHNSALIDPIPVRYGQKRRTV